MKKVFCIVMCIFIALSLSSCTATKKQEEAKEREKYIERYDNFLRGLDATLSQSIIDDEKYSNTPWVNDRVQLPDSEIIVSLDELRASLYIYELENLYSNEGQKTISLTAEDIIGLYFIQNTEKYAELKRLFDYYTVGMSDKKRIYYRFAYASYKHYEKKFGKPFLGKEWKMYSAEDTYNLVKWAIGNIDYDYIDEIFATELDKNSTDPGKDYVNYLYHLGLIDLYYSGSKMIIGVAE